MRIKINVKLPVDNEIQFYDACHGIADKLIELGQKALDDGDIDQFKGLHVTVTAANDDADDIGDIIISGGK